MSQSQLLSEHRDLLDRALRVGGYTLVRKLHDAVESAETPEAARAAAEWILVDAEQTWCGL